MICRSFGVFSASSPTSQTRLGKRDDPVSRRAGSNYLKGAAFGLAAASIWASWSAVTRLAVTASLDAWDIAALRFGVAGLLLTPVLVRRGLAVDRLGWHVGGRSDGWTASRSFGDALFLCASLLTACFTVVMSRAKLDPLHAAALVATGSLVLYLPVYLVLFGTRLARLSFADLAIQAIFRGILVTLISVVL